MDNEAPLKKGKRVRPGRSLERRIWDESGSRCQFCGRVGTTSLQIHHLDENPENTVDANLLAICGGCHEDYKHGKITRNDAFRVKYYLTEGKPPFPPLPAPPVRAAKTKKTTIKVAVNKGQVAETIINKNYGPQKSPPVKLSGSIKDDLNRYNYMEYLIRRLAKFRQAGASFGQKRRSVIHPGVIRKNINDEWGALPKDLGLEKWDRLVQQLRDKIDFTALGRGRAKRGQQSYRSFDDFCAMGPDED